MCDRFGDCSNDGTCQLVLRNRRTGMELVEHHCKAHLVLRIWEVERDETFEVVDARTLDLVDESEDPSEGEAVAGHEVPADVDDLAVYDDRLERDVVPLPSSSEPSFGPPDVDE